jgi:hypothetical protein
VPSAEEATEYQPSFGASVAIQVAPEFVEVKIKPALTPNSSGPSRLVVATHLLPSAEVATQRQELFGGPRIAFSNAVEALGNLVHAIH